MTNNVAALLEVLQSYAPNKKARLLCQGIVDSAYTENMTEDEIVTMLCGITFDGLRHGNWPWVLKAMIKNAP